MLVDSVIDPVYYNITGIEENLSSYEITFNELTTDNLDIPMTVEYISEYDPEGAYLTTQSFSPMQVDTEDKSNAVAIKNTFDTPPTGLDIFKNPDIWMLIFAIIATLVFYGPIKIIFVRRRRRLELLMINSKDELLFEDGFVC